MICLYYTMLNNIISERWNITVSLTDRPLLLLVVYSPDLIILYYGSFANL